MYSDSKEEKSTLPYNRELKLIIKSTFNKKKGRDKSKEKEIKNHYKLNDNLEKETQNLTDIFKVQGFQTTII